MPDGWDEADSGAFIEYGRFLVPARETQLALMGTLIPPASTPFTVLDLACGEGVLAEAVLQQHPTSTVLGYDRSPAMMDRAIARLAPFGPRFQAHTFELADTTWRRPGTAARAIVSSLAIHHLEDGQKQQLFRDLAGMLAPGGALLIADLIRPATTLATAAAADAWDAAVRRRSLRLAGHTGPYDYFVQQRWNIFRYPDPMDRPAALPAQLRWLAAAGLTGVDVFWLQAGHAVFGGYRPEQPVH